MTKQEFIDQKKQFERNYRIKDIVSFSLFLGFLLVINLFTDRVPDEYGYYFVVALLAFMGFFYLFVLFLNKRMIRKSGLFCHSCSEPILGNNASVAIATDNCPICGNRAFDGTSITKPSRNSR